MGYLCRGVQGFTPGLREEISIEKKGKTLHTPAQSLQSSHLRGFVVFLDFFCEK